MKKLKKLLSILRPPKNESVTTDKNLSERLAIKQYGTYYDGIFGEMPTSKKMIYILTCSN
jgi:hypothetical protein